MKWLLLPLACMIVHVCDAQNKEDKIYLYNKNWKAASDRKAEYMVRVRQEDTCFTYTTYNMPGPRISQLRYKDEAGKILNGWCAYYRPNGQLDSAGAFREGIKDGPWFYHNTSGVVTKRKDYEKGVFLKDSVYASDPFEVWKKRDAVTGEVESSFKGGPAGWANFMKENFIYPVSAQKGNIQGTVVLEFVIDEKGTPCRPEIYRSADYALDEEALRLIRQSPAWVPATKEGKALQSYKLQPVIFRLQ